MEVGNVHNTGPQKAEELRESRPVGKKAANAYAKVEQKDSVDVSSKAKLLLKLREAYDKLPEVKSDRDVKEMKEKVEKDVLDMTSEDLVNSILKGTLFEIV